MDALVVRALARLESHGPPSRFADKVMTRVSLPQPRAVLILRRARAWVLQPRRALVLAEAYAVSAVIALALAIPWLLSNSPAISLAAGWTLGRIVDSGREIVLAAARWSVSSGLAGFVESLPLTGPSLFAGAGILAAGYGGCALGLHYLMRAPRGKDAPVQAHA
jgi:hypothetical protein